MWGTISTSFRNGTESRESLPLWNGAELGNTSERFPEGTATRPACRNGTESPEMLPLRQTVTMFTASQPLKKTFRPPPFDFGQVTSGILS